MTEWVAVHEGPFAEVHDLQLELEALGFETLVEREEDLAALCVPLAVRERAGAALDRLLDSLRAERAAALERERILARPEVAHTERLGRAVCTLFLTTVAAPLAFLLGMRYLARVRSLEVHPTRHRTVLTAIWGSAAVTVVWIVLLVQRCTVG